MAAAGLIVAIFFVGLLVALALIAFSGNKPLIEFWLFAFPILGIVFAFAGRRHIVNSEGTRTGLQLASVAWWLCLVSGLSYAAYLGATEYTIRTDTEKQFVAWAVNLKKADPNSPGDPALAMAFYQTLPPQQRAFSPTNTTVMQDRFGQDFAAFRQNKLLVMIVRNPGEAELIPQGLKQWQYSPGKIECALGALLKTPEGEFPLTVPMEAILGDKGKREWQIKVFEGIVGDGPGVKRTAYGWLVDWLEFMAKLTFDQFLKTASAPTYVEGIPGIIGDGLLAQPVAFEMFRTNTIPRTMENRLIAAAHERAKVVGGLGLVWPTSPAYAQAMKEGFFVQIPLPDGKMMPDTNPREDFLYCWNNIAYEKITPSGRTMPNSPDKNPMLRFFPDRVEISLPIELKPPKADPKNAAAIGRIVFVIDDPAFLAKINATREESKAGQGGTELPVEFQKMPSPWRLARIESNLKIIKAQSASGGPGGPGGPGE